MSARPAIAAALAALITLSQSSSARADIVIDDFEAVDDWRGLEPEAATVKAGAVAGAGRRVAADRR